MSTRLRAALLTETRNGKTVAEAIALKVAVEVLKNPVKNWRILEWIEERELGKTPLAILLQDQQSEGPRVIDHDTVARAKALDEYLVSLDSPRRAATVAVLADIDRAIPGFLGFE